MYFPPFGSRFVDKFPLLPRQTLFYARAPRLIKTRTSELSRKFESRDFIVTRFVNENDASEGLSRI